MDQEETTQTAGGFLRQVDQIRQSLEQTEDVEEREPVEAWQDEASQVGEQSVPITEEEDVLEGDLKRVLNDPKGEEGPWDEFVQRVKESGSNELTGRQSIVERLVSLFRGEADNPPQEASNLLMDMKFEELEHTRAYKKLEEQVELFQQAEQKLKDLEEHLGPEETVEKEGLKLRAVLVKSARRVPLQKVQEALKSFEKLGDWPIFECLHDRIDNVRERLDQIYQLRADFKQYWEKFPRDRFRKMLRVPDEIDDAYSRYQRMLEAYASASIKDELCESNLWCLESAFKAGFIIAGKRRVELDLFERIYDSLGGQEMAKFDLAREAKQRLQVCHGLVKWGKRLKSGISVNFEEMKRSFQEYNELCSNVEIGDALDHVKKSLALMEKTLKKTDVPLSLAELKDVRAKIKNSAVISEREVANLEKRIFLGEKLLRRISQLTDEDLAAQYESLNQEYEKCWVKIPKFEELTNRHQKEEYFVRNVEQFASEDGDQPLSRIKQLRDEFNRFAFCRYCEVGLYLANKEVETYMREWKSMLQQGKSQSEARVKLLDIFKLNLDHFQQLETDLTVYRDKIRQEIQHQISKKSSRPILYDLMKSECDKLQDNLIFLRTVYTKKDGLKSGKTSVFEKSVECFLETYKSKLVNKQLLPLPQMVKPAITIREEDLRKSVVDQLKNLFESCEMLGVQHQEAAFIARDIEQGIYVKLLDKAKYEAVLRSVIEMFTLIKKHNLVELAKHIRQHEYRPKLILKLSGMPSEFLTRVEQKLVVVRDNKRRNMFAKKYLAPFEDPSLIEKKIKKLKPMEEFDGMSVDDESESDGIDEPRDRRKGGVHADEPFVPVESIDDNDSMFGDEPRGTHRSLLTARPIKKLHSYEFVALKSLSVPKTSDSVGKFVFYNIFSGKARIEGQGEPRPADLDLFTCAEENFIKYFSKLPDSLGLVLKLDRRDFENYIDKALITEQKNYIVLPGFLDSAQLGGMKADMDAKKLVMSSNYSKKCKLFIFPREYCQSSWLDVLNIILVKEPSRKLEVLFFLVLKLSASDDEHQIEPKAYCLGEKIRPLLMKKSLSSGIIEKPIDVGTRDISKTNKDNKVLNSKPGVADQEKKHLHTSKPIKKMNLEDVNISLDPSYTRRNKLNELLRGSTAAALQNSAPSKKDSGTKEDRLDVSGQKRRLEEALGLHTPVANRSQNPGLGRSGSSGFDDPKNMQRMFERNLNSDQKLFVDGFEDYQVNLTQRGIMDSAGAFNLEENARFSDDGNNSIPEEQTYDFDQEAYYESGRRGFGMREEARGPYTRVVNYDINENPDVSDPHFNRPYNPMLRQGPDPRPGQTQKQFADVPYQPHTREKPKQSVIDIEQR